MNRLRRCYAALIHAHDLLLARDNSRFYDRGDFGRLDERLGGNAFVVQEISQPASGSIGADHAAYLDRAAERPEISRNICRATGIERFALTSTTGTGASGEIRETFPQTNSSNMTSPTTSNRCLRASSRRYCILSTFI